MGLKRKRGLIVAIDVIQEKEYEKLRDILSSIAELDKNIIFMPGIPTTLKFGFYNVMNFLKNYENKVIFNAKLVEDQERKVKRILEMCKECELDGIIVHGCMNKEIIKNLSKESGCVDVIAVTKMSSKTFVYNENYEKIVESIIKYVDGVVVGANEPGSIKKVRKIIDEVDSSIYICSPGIGYQGGEARIALESGADYLIVGRDILKAEKPKKKVKEYLRLLKLK